mgnify:CR=1 FL=1
MDHREIQENRGKSASQNGSAHVPPQIRPTGHLLQRATASRRARLPAQRAMQTRNMTAGCKGTQPTTARTKQTGFRVLSFKSQTISPEETSATSTRAYASAAAVFTATTPDPLVHVLQGTLPVVGCKLRQRMRCPGNLFTTQPFLEY